MNRSNHESAVKNSYRLFLQWGKKMYEEKWQTVFSSSHGMTNVNLNETKK